MTSETEFIKCITKIASQRGMDISDLKEWLEDKDAKLHTQLVLFLNEQFPGLPVDRMIEILDDLILKTGG